MARTMSSTTLPTGAITLHQIGRRLDTAMRGLSAWMRARRTAAELHRLTPAQLNDIGVTEADIERYVRTGRW